MGLKNASLGEATIASAKKQLNNATLKEENMRNGHKMQNNANHGVKCTKNAEKHVLRFFNCIFLAFLICIFFALCFCTGIFCITWCIFSGWQFSRISPQGPNANLIYSSILPYPTLSYPIPSHPTYPNPSILFT